MLFIATMQCPKPIRGLALQFGLQKVRAREFRINRRGSGAVKETGSALHRDLSSRAAEARAGSRRAWFPLELLLKPTKKTGAATSKPRIEQKWGRAGSEQQIVGSRPPLMRRSR